MYPAAAATRVTVPGISEELDGKFRPGHFSGVATVVTKLFLQVMPDIAVFGEKDYQQLLVIRQLARDLDIPVRVLGAPIQREEDGLALSSRNRYLSLKERAIAGTMNQILSQAAHEIEKGMLASVVLAQASEALLMAGFNKVDYVDLRDANTLLPVQDSKSPARLLAAAHLGTTRLIDNRAVGT